MKTLRSLDLKLCRNCHNVLRYENTDNGDLFVGVIKPKGIETTEESSFMNRANPTVRSIIINTEWVIRFRQALDVSTSHEATTWQPIVGSRKEDCRLEFSSPRVESHQPLIFLSHKDRVEIHPIDDLTALAFSVLSKYTL